jgi:signal transduction histidine kinase
MDGNAYEHLRLLLVDDDRVDRMAVRRALREAGVDAEVTEVDSAEGCLAALGAGAFDAILLDYRLPGRSGLEALQDIRARGIRTPVLMLTGHGDELLAVELMKAGAADYIPKASLRPERLGQGLRHAVLLHDAQEEARAAQESLRQRIEDEQKLIAIVSHDLRNPLHAILLSSTALMRLDGGLDDRTQRIAVRIRTSADRATRLIRDLLDFTQARLGAGIPIERRPIDARDVVRQALDEMQQAHPRRQFHSAIEGDGRGEFDPDRLAQVLTNLLVNAVTYSRADTPVSVRVQGSAEEVRVEVHNHGDPIPDDLLPSLFEPLRRGEGAGQGAPGNVGLGLFIVDQIVRAHGGTIEVKSSAALGTTFAVRLPRTERL